MMGTATKQSSPKNRKPCNPDLRVIRTKNRVGIRKKRAKTWCFNQRGGWEPPQKVFGGRPGGGKKIPGRTGSSIGTMTKVVGKTSEGLEKEAKHYVEERPQPKKKEVKFQRRKKMPVTEGDLSWQQPFRGKTKARRKKRKGSNRRNSRAK